jgi:hypothetical protein
MLLFFLTRSTGDTTLPGVATNSPLSGFPYLSMGENAFKLPHQVKRRQNPDRGYQKKVKPLHGIK